MTNFIELLTYVKQKEPQYLDVSIVEKFDIEITEDDYNKLYTNIFKSGYKIFNSSIEDNKYESNELVGSHKDKTFYIPPNKFVKFIIK